MSKVYDIDYKRLIVLLLPSDMRKPRLFAVIKAMIAPIVVLYDQFKVNRSLNLYKVNRTGQVCHLRGMLNDNFDPSLRRIVIADGITSDWTILYKYSLFNAIDNKQPLWVGFANSSSVDGFGNTTAIFNQDNTVSLISKQGSVGTAGIDFLVMVPMALRGIVDENRIKAQVNYYKLASKRYEIQYF